MSNYTYVRDNYPFINTLKFRYSFGLVGNDKIERGGSEVRFPYLTRVNVNASGYYFGDIPGYYSGVTDAELGSTGLVWESAKKHNWGIDLTLWDNAINITVDAFLDKRDNIFMAQHVTRNAWNRFYRLGKCGTDEKLGFGWYRILHEENRGLHH